MTMIFDAYAFLEKLNSEAEQAATPATPATRTIKTAPYVAEVADVAEGSGAKHKPTTSAKTPEKPPVVDAPSPYGQTFGGRQRTWTGKIVSLDEWRRATDWERHGSTDKLWNGLTRQWEAKT